MRFERIREEALSFESAGADSSRNFRTRIIVEAHALYNRVFASLAALSPCVCDPAR